MQKNENEEERILNYLLDSVSKILLRTSLFIEKNKCQLKNFLHIFAKLIILVNLI